MKNALLALSLFVPAFAAHAEIEDSANEGALSLLSQIEYSPVLTTSLRGCDHRKRVKLKRPTP
jgi:hypothetical protein|tara:strand:+ start:4456 stop:4644 length:189 start_codon:yes stop_codon:yes gene_type:complete